MVFKDELSIPDIDLLCQQYLMNLYQGITQNNFSKKISETYGEVLYSSVDKLILAMKLSDSDVFVDYGSGLGKMVIQVFLKSLVKEAYGIEIVPELHQYAINALIKVQDLTEFYEGERRLDFKLGDFLKFPLRSATVAFINSACLSPGILVQLGKIINDLPNLHTVISLRPIPELIRFQFKKSIHIECSWDSALAYFYAL